MKVIILFTLLAFPFLFYLESPSYSGEIPCEISFHSASKEQKSTMPFSYYADCDLNCLQVELFNSHGTYVQSITPLEPDSSQPDLLPDGVYYYVAHYRFVGNEMSYKKAGTIVVH